MIDDKKIEEAARGAADLYEQDLPIMSYYEDTEVDGQHHFCQKFGPELFKDGAKWAINEFLKGLWHPASEEPKFGKGRLLVLINGSVSILNVGFVLDQLRNLHNIYGIVGWLYLDDLFPKEGGNHD